MEEVPSILVTDGWNTDKNGALVEVVIPSYVDTYQPPTKITFLGDNLNYVPADPAVLQEFEAPNIAVIPANNLFSGYTSLRSVSFPSCTSIAVDYNKRMFYSCSNLTSISFPSLTTIGVNSSCDGGLFCNCTSLTSVSFPELTTIVDNTGNNGLANGGLFYNCSSLSSVSMPKLTSITLVTGGASGVFGNCTSLETLTLPELTAVSCSYGGLIRGCTALRTINFPKIQTLTSGNNANTGAFANNTYITSVTLGSVGNPVSSIGAYTFGNCTQSGLTITIYTEGGASLADEPWGATNSIRDYKVA